VRASLSTDSPLFTPLLSIEGPRVGSLTRVRYAASMPVSSCAAGVPSLRHDGYDETAEPTSPTQQPSPSILQSALSPPFWSSEGGTRRAGQRSGRCVTPMDARPVTPGIISWITRGEANVQIEIRTKAPVFSTWSPRRQRFWPSAALLCHASCACFSALELRCHGHGICPG
jgi:hypothetical protein